MINRRGFLVATAGVAAVAAAGLQARDASAQSGGVEVRVGESVLFQLPRIAQIIDTEDHSVATMTVLPDGHARVTGVSEGRTRIIGRDLAQLPLIFPVTVTAARPAGPNRPTGPAGSGI